MKREVEPFGDDVITMRPVELRDLEMILDWRNRDESRVWFKTSDKLPLDSHKKWFDRYLTKEDDLFFIIEAKGEPVGQCAIYDIDRAAGVAEVGRFLVAPDKSGFGYITRACNLLTQFGRDTLKLPTLFLEVIDNNERAIRIYKRCGYTEDKRYDGLIKMSFKDDTPVTS